MQQSIYPKGTVQALLQTDFVNNQTKQVLQQRLEPRPIVTPKFFTADEFNVLQAVCKRLIPQQRENPIDMAGQLDTDLAANTGNGWRYNSMPPDQESFKLGINGIEETAHESYQSGYINLSENEQDTILTQIQSGNAAGKIWQQLPGALFFEELLSRLVEIYYSHPLGKNEIGEVSFADAYGWQQIGLNEREKREPLPVGEIIA